MNNYKKSLVVAIILATLSACGSSGDSAASFIDNGKTLVEQGKFEKARLEFKNAIQIDPRQAEPYYQLALLDEKKQEWKSMYANLTAAEQLDPNNNLVAIKLGQLYLISGELDKAKENADKVLATEPANIKALVLLSSVDLKKGNYPGAIENVEKVLKVDPENIEAISVKALVMKDQKNIEGSLALLDNALKIKPNDTSISMIKISILESQQRYDEVEQVYLALQENNPDALWVVTSLAKLYNIQDRYDDAQKVLEKFGKDHPDNKEVNNLLVSLAETRGSEVALPILNNLIEKEPENYQWRFRKAQLLFNEQQNDEALAEINKVIELDPDGNEGRSAKVILANFQYQTNDIEAAKKTLKQITDVESENNGALLLRAKINMRERKFEQAVTDLRVVLRNVPDSDQALTLLAQTYMQTGAKQLADENFKQAFSVNPGNSTAALSIAGKMMSDRELDRSEEVLRKALSNAKDKVLLYQALAQVRLMKKDFTGTQQIIDVLNEDEGNLPLTAYLSGRIYQEQGKFEEAAEQYQISLKANPALARSLEGLSSVYVKLNKNDELLAYLQNFTSTYPSQLYAFNILSQVYLKQGETQKAVDTLKGILQKEPSWEAGYSAIAAIYIKQDKVSEIIDAYEKGIKAIPDTIILRLQLASAYERKAEYEKAKDLYEEILKIRPDTDPAINNLASLLTDVFKSEENLNKALTMARKFRRSTNPYYLDTYAWVLVQKNQLQEAQVILEQVTGLAPDTAIFNYHLGMLYIKQAKSKKAQEYLNKAKSLADKQGDDATFDLASKALNAF